VARPARRIEEANKSLNCVTGALVRGTAPGMHAAGRAIDCQPSGGPHQLHGLRAGAIDLLFHFYICHRHLQVIRRRAGGASGQRRGS
jgi:hypothetical protein